MENKNKVLILAPHTDDGEFGCGGTIAKFIETGKEIYYVAFSDCKKSLPPDMPSDTLVIELNKAMQKLGVCKGNIQIKEFEVRCFERDRQDILECIVTLEHELKPDIVLLPSPQDLHQDHQTIAMEGLRAFKRSATVLGYEMPWNNLSFNTTCFVSLLDKHVQKKIDALDCYNSQKDRFYATPNFIKSLATTRGSQIGVKYAETFDVLRWIIN